MKRLLQQLINFAVVGGISTLIDFVVLFLMYEILGINYLIGTAVAFIVATVFNYWASMRYIFTSKYEAHQRGKEFTIFLVLSVLGLVLTQFLMVIFVEWLSISVMIAKVFVTVFVMVFNFVTRKLLLDDSSGTVDERELTDPNKIVVEEASQYDQ